MRSVSFQTLVDQNPENEMFRFSLGQALVQEERPGDAIPHLQVCVDRKPDWMMPRILLGKSLLAVNRRSEARPVLVAALELAVQQNHETPEEELRALLADWPEDDPEVT
jgi:thioredoxin-like negative regulator of GroEL